MHAQPVLLFRRFRLWRVLLLFLVLPLAGANGPDWRTKVDARVLQNAASGDSEFLVFLAEQADVKGAAAFKTKREKGSHVVHRLRETAGRTQAPLLRYLEKRKIAHRPYWLANMIWVRADRSVLRTLGERSDVLCILANTSVRLQEPDASPAALTEVIEWNVAQVHAPEVWALGYTGQGVVIAGQDTGYQWNHAALQSRYRGWDGVSADHNYNWHDAIHTTDVHNVGVNPAGYDSPVPLDDHWHGTHTMGTLVGDDGLGNRIGLAPGARWIGCRNMDRGWGTPATYTECFEWFIAPTDLNGENPDPARAPDVINNSWGCPPEEGGIDPNILLSIVERVRAAGIVVVVSAGNSGPGAGSVDDAPAIYDASFSVGAANSSGVIASFSSRGPVTVDGSGRMKPDITAPGVNVRSSVPGGYASYSGTSMAGPHVAGVVALMLSAHPELRGQVDAIERIITETAIPTGTPIPNTTYGWGRVDALAALGLGDSDNDTLPDWWEIWHDLNRTNAADAELDIDTDGFSARDEYTAGTDPRDSASALRITAIRVDGAGVVSEFTSVTGRTYALERTGTLGSHSWDTVVSNLTGTGSVFRVRDTNAAAAGSGFYRINVRLP
jgi:serine protease AprX